MLWQFLPLIIAKFISMCKNIYFMGQVTYLNYDYNYDENFNDKNDRRNSGGTLRQN